MRFWRVRCKIFCKAPHKYCKIVQCSHILRLCPQTGRELAAGVTSVIFSNTPSGSKKKASFSWNFYARLSPTKWVHKGPLGLRLSLEMKTEKRDSERKWEERFSDAQKKKWRRKCEAAPLKAGRAFNCGHLLCPNLFREKTIIFISKRSSKNDDVKTN